MKKPFILILILLLAYSQSTFSSAPAKTSKVPNVMIAPAELAKMMESAKETVYYDIRPYIEYSIFHAPKSVNMPMRYLNNRIDEVKKYNQIVIIANDEKEAALAAQMIRAKYPDKRVRILSGGVDSWVKSGLPIQNELPHGC
ncbi:rhodanese-like domain-containing protein [Seleniivibrio woodruffii]|uniref:rhodanese-like domain-containing protein n=1 Tax=Seleniivibrio woodruffii TaxID=1078050 RepID=UPI00240A6E89|nr:rhodanese-like domain-containing protein [Seleniivibrio woodruffii]